DWWILSLSFSQKERALPPQHPISLGSKTRCTAGRFDDTVTGSRFTESRGYAPRHFVDMDRPFDLDNFHDKISKLGNRSLVRLKVRSQGKFSADIGGRRQGKMVDLDQFLSNILRR